MEERLHKVLAGAGVASRRESERLIAAGRVCVDGRVVNEMGVKVDPERQAITVDGKPIQTDTKRVYVLLNKPKGFVTTRYDPHATRTVMDLLGDEVPGSVHPVGRLDKDTEGALLLTNDGAFTELLTHPRHAVPKLYQAHVTGIPDEKALERLRTGVRLEDGMTAPAKVRVIHAEGERAVLEITLHEGRKRQVRRMLEAVGHPVEHLRRLAVGPISIRKLPKGAWRYLSQKEVDQLRRAATPREAREETAARPTERTPLPRREPPRPSRPETAPGRENRGSAAPRPDGKRPGGWNAGRSAERGGRPAQRGARPQPSNPPGKPAGRIQPRGGGERGAAPRSQPPGGRSGSPERGPRSGARRRPGADGR